MEELVKAMKRLETWRLVLKKMTPREVTLTMVGRVFETSGMRIDFKGINEVYESIKASERANVYEALNDPELQKKIEKLVTFTDPVKEEIAMDQRNFVWCPHCRLGFELQGG